MSDFGTRIKLKWFFMDQPSKAFVLTDKPRRHFLGQPCRNWRHIVARETNMADTLYCICRQAYDPSQFMIQCDSCEEWFHGRLAFIVPRFRVTLKGEKKNYQTTLFSCVGIEEHQASDIERYHCPQCALLCGPLTCKYSS